MSNKRVDRFLETLQRRQAERAGQPAAPQRASATPDAPSGDEPARAFDTAALAKLGRLDLIARTVVDGFLSGKHRSTHKGGCTDFSEFRPYARGDDVRLIDWRHYGRSDRYYVKQYDDETNLQALLVVDASGSMSFGMSTVTKWTFAQMAAASLAHLLVRQRDSVGLAVAGGGAIDYVRPLPRASHLTRVFDRLAAARPSGASVLPDVLSELLARLKRRGMVILISDCFCDVARLKHALEQYRFHGHDVLVVQILAPEEVTFPFRREAFFQDLEHSTRMQVNPNTVRSRYLAEFRAFMDQLSQSMIDIGVDRMTVSSGDDLGDVLAYHLRRRAAMKTGGHARARS